MIVQNRLSIISDQPILRQILKSLDLSYVQFAQKMNMSISTLEHYRSGYSKPRFSISQIKAMLLILDEAGVNIHDLPDDWIIDKHNN
jgi:transcriptional regulator with XRE-family HTH domain